MRNRAKASLEREAEILREVLSEAATVGVVIIPPLKPLVEAKLGKTLSLSTLYAMLARHGWRKLAPRKRHTQADAEIQEDWEKKLPSRLIEEIAAFANKRPTRLMFQVEARFGCISDTRSCWHKKPHRPQVRMVLTHQYTYAYGAVSPLDGRFDSLILVSFFM